MQVRKQQLELDMEQQTFQIGKGVRQGCIFSPCLFNLYVEYIMRNSDFGAPQKIKSLTVSIVSPSIHHEVFETDAMILVF